MIPQDPKELIYRYPILALIFWNVIGFFWWVFSLAILFACLYQFFLFIKNPDFSLSFSTKKDGSSSLLVQPLYLFFTYFSSLHLITTARSFFKRNVQFMGKIEKLYTKDVEYAARTGIRHYKGYFIEDAQNNSWEITRITFQTLGEKIKTHPYFQLLCTADERDVRKLWISSLPIS